MLSQTVRKSESAFYDAWAHYGHDSAEAMAAKSVWKERRRQLANRILPKQRREEQGPWASYGPRPCVR